jgi:hypothetical protein
LRQKSLTFSKRFPSLLYRSVPQRRAKRQNSGAFAVAAQQSHQLYLSQKLY